VVDRLAEHLNASTKLFMDETTAPVLAPGRGRTSCRRRVFDTTTGYLWALARDDRNWGGADPPGVVFFYAPGRGGKNAETFLRRIADIYKVEADIRVCAPGQRLSARHARTAELVAAFGDWLPEQRLRVSAKSRLGEKLAYIHRHWEGLQTFLHDGRVEIDSNSVENLIRPIALNRKNAL
ncbi:IS66 family transposase, partial [Roseovarius sp. D22-M7]|uniref:IS66 family transposase n=1 Tax=Roseovarius sp. D22-M7 TaxID=3127116 RepID=UPI0030104A09